MKWQKTMALDAVANIKKSTQNKKLKWKASKHVKMYIVHIQWKKSLAKTMNFSEFCIYNNIT